MEVWLLVVLIRSIVGRLLSATVSGTCADIVSMTHLTSLPASVMRSGQVSVFGLFCYLNSYKSMFIL